MIINTPRTDDKAQCLLRALGPINGRFASMCDFARTLEEETQNLKAEIEKLKELLKTYEL